VRLDNTLGTGIRLPRWSEKARHWLLFQGIEGDRRALRRDKENYFKAQQTVLILFATFDAGKLSRGPRHKRSPNFRTRRMRRGMGE
jgi:hypothetical protein